MRILITCILCIVLAGCAPVTVQSVYAKDRISGVSIKCLPSSIKRQLQYISKTFGPISVVSANRPGARIAGTKRKSWHSKCRAVDFHVRGKGKQAKALKYLRTKWGGGLGTYSGCMHHIHLDNGRRVRFHHKVNCSGRRIK